MVKANKDILKYCKFLFCQTKTEEQLLFIELFIQMLKFTSFL